MRYVMVVLAALVVLATAEREAAARTFNDEKSPLDISWMNDSQKKVLDNFITWYKLQLSQIVNVLNPVHWNLDVVMPAVSSVITLYTGPIVALGILLLIFFTIPTLTSGLLLNPGRSNSESIWTPTLDTLWHVVQKALDHPRYQE